MLDRLMRPLATLIAAALLGVLAAVPAQGQSIDFGGFGGGADDGDFPAEVRASAEVAPGSTATTVTPGGLAVVAVVLDHTEGFHSWPSAEVELIPDLDAFAIRTAIEVVAPETVTVGAIQWPKAKPSKVPSLTGEGTMEAPTYAGRAVAYVPLRVSEDATGELDIEVLLTYQACDDQICLAPEFPEFDIRLTVDAAAGGIPTAGDFAGFDASRADTVPVATPTPAEPTVASGGAGEAAIEGEPAEPAEAASTAATDGVGDATFFGIPIPSQGIAGIVGLAALCALGGFVLNLTPCVLPVIPIKVMTLSQHAGESRGRAVYLGLWMALGVTAFWFAIGVPAALFSQAADASRVFGLWYVTLPIGLIVSAMALGLMGLFAINLPKAAYAFNPKADNASGSFLFGVMTGVLGLPCFGFVVGALIPIAASVSPFVVILSFTAIGLGMAAPYLVLAVFPKLVDKLPRTGPASELVKQFLGLLLFGAGLFFAGTGLLSLSKTYPFIAGQFHIIAVSLAALAAGGWLAWRTMVIAKKPVGRAVFGGLGVAVAASGVWLSVNGVSSARAEHERREAELAAIEQAERERVAALEQTLEDIQARVETVIASGGGGGNGLVGIVEDLASGLANAGPRFPTTVWVDYTPDRLADAIDAGHAVFIDFTADWCINCKVFEKATLDKDPVRSHLHADDVIMMKVDMTGSNPDGEALLSSLNRVGLPIWAVHGPGFDRPRVVQAGVGAAVESSVITALDDARERTVALRTN